MAPFAASASPAALSYGFLRRRPSPICRFSATFFLPLPSATLDQSRRLSAVWPTPLRSRRGSSSSLPAMASEKALASKGKQGLLVFDTEEELSVSLAKYAAELSEKFIRERGAFTVVISGGSLVKSLRKLTESPYLETVEWAKWHIFWVDERVVPKDHEDSNYKLAFDGFLSKVPIPPGQVCAINDALSAPGAAEDYETALKHLVNIGVVVKSATGYPRFDLMLLGMGPDGHIASLFPSHPLLNVTDKWVAFIKDSPKPPPERITFTLPVINSSSYVAMVVAGAGKAGVVGKALGNEKTADLLPVEMISLEDGELTWFADNAAVSMLPDKPSL
ncbi:putative 6-phosphogluconolactonase 4, chloroplastic [Curcuma longa]|uniref:putative 6-phosphogluconolactonase 4, chloroplastic n=1 Tax=Curcuma longa TaxID=136217 RepID=UPI003D9DFAB5